MSEDKKEERKNEESSGPDLRDKHESDLTKKEKRLLEKQKLKGMGAGKKLEYIWMYYKPVIFGFVGFIALIFIGVDIYQNAQKETVLSISVVNAGDIDSQAIGEEIKKLLGAEGKYKQVDVAANLITDGKGETFDYYTQMAYVTQVQTQTLDILVMPESLYKNLIKDDPEIFADLKKILGDEAYDSFGGQIDEHHAALSGSALKGYFDVIYDPVCVSVLVNSKNTENAGKWIASLAE